MCQHTHVYADKYGHTRDDRKGQRVKIIDQHINTADVKAAGSTNGLGVTKSVKRFLSEL